MTDVLKREELNSIGFKSIGTNVFISRKASFYSPEKISIGNDVRIDDFCVLSGNITIKDYVHVAVFSALFGGKMGIEIESFCNISSRVSIYAISDDYSGVSMTNPMVPDKYKNICQEKVILKKHVIIGSNSVVLPGAYLAEGASFGSFSLIKSKIEPWSINVGIPCKKIKNRNKDILNLETKFLKEQGDVSFNG